MRYTYALRFKDVRLHIFLQMHSLDKHQYSLTCLSEVKLGPVCLVLVVGDAAVMCLVGSSEQLNLVSTKNLIVSGN
jgi:hypothetical protein